VAEQRRILPTLCDGRLCLHPLPGRPSPDLFHPEDVNLVNKVVRIVRTVLKRQPQGSHDKLWTLSSVYRRKIQAGVPSRAVGGRKLFSSFCLGGFFLGKISSLAPHFSTVEESAFRLSPGGRAQILSPVLLSHGVLLFWTVDSLVVLVYTKKTGLAATTS